METENLIRFVIGLCIKIHSKIGPGCFEKVYEEILYYELAKAGYQVSRQLLLPISYESLNIERAYKIDLLVENRLIVELKSVYPLPSVYFQQLKTQLTLTNLKNGLIANFKTALMKEGIHRVYNNKGNDIFLH